MKLSTASVVATFAAFAPSLVSAVNITVTVGSKDGTPANVFEPQQITAQKGDIVNFMFAGGNHTVTQSSFLNPCAWQFNTATQQNGFNSGFVPYDASTGQIGVYSLEITQTENPIWIFCGRPPHCKSGMFGAINPPATGNRTFEQFAANVQTTDEPGLGVTVPFTPPNASSAPSSGVPPTGVASTPAPSGAASPTSSGAASTSTGTSANQGTGAAGTVTAHSAVVLGLAGLVAGLIL
jgi:plastocyanin